MRERLEMYFSPRTLEVLEPVVRAAAEAEWESGQTLAELMNFANELAARRQRTGEDR